MKDVINLMYSNLEDKNYSKSPIWVLMNSGTFKKEGKIKIFEGTNDEGKKVR